MTNREGFTWLRQNNILFNYLRWFQTLFFAGSLFLIHNSAVAASFHLLRRQHSPYCLDGPGATSCITTIPGLLYHFPHLSINCIQLLFHMWHFLSHKKTTNLGYYILVKYPIKFTIIRYWILVKYRTKSTTMRYWIDPFSKSPIQSTHKSNKPTNLINH